MQTFNRELAEVTRQTQTERNGELPGQRPDHQLLQYSTTEGDESPMDKRGSTQL